MIILHLLKNYKSKKTCLQFSFIFQFSTVSTRLQSPRETDLRTVYAPAAWNTESIIPAWQKTRGTMESYGSKINRWPALSHGLTALLQQCGSLWLPRVLNEQSVQCPVGCCFTEVCLVDMKRTTLLLGTCLQWLVVCSWSKDGLS